jgi:7-cyano-7-deazaguanine synthase in queuosine biosynthesis
MSLATGTIVLGEGANNPVEFNFETAFPKYIGNMPHPSTDTKMAVGMSGGIESTILAYILTQRYGADKVIGISAQMPERRFWEAQNASLIATQLGIQFHAIDNPDDPFTNMGRSEGFQLRRMTRDVIGAYTAWWWGTSATRFSTRTPITDAQEERMKAKGVRIMLPFRDLMKEHTIDLYKQLNVEWLLGLSYSCTQQPLEPCTTCYCCNERMAGFHLLASPDPGFEPKAPY